MRRLVIGDIHGALKALLQCLDRCNYNPSEDQIIFLGDYVDGWPESAELIEELRKMDNCIFIRGNHDKWCEEWLLFGNAPNIWVNQGGEATLDSYTNTSHQSDQKHSDFFRRMHNYYISEDNIGFVHGGFTSKKGLGHEPYQNNYYWDRSLWDSAMFTAGIISNKRSSQHKEIFIGHSATTSFGKDTPMNKGNVWNLDTGAGWHGKLTVMDVDTKEYWQSDYVKELYPNHLGR